MALHVTSATGLLTPFFRDGPVRDYADAKDCDTEPPTPPSAARCSARGIYLPPSQFEAWFPSLAHTDEHVERTRRGGARCVRGGGR